MCGVIGYVGHREAKERLLRGLERLEYRGYDSAGICLLERNGLDSVKAVGKLENLKGKAVKVASSSTTGIGHTRWATHGPVSERNAHPLMPGDHGDVAIVLNGIIENYGELKRELIANGDRFASQTDAEVVAHLVKRSYSDDLVDAVQSAYRKLSGHFAFIAVHRDHPNELVGARNRCPLLVGVGEGEQFLASSITAFAADTNRFKVIDDDEIVAVTPDHARVMGIDGEERERDDVVVPWDDEVADKRGFETYMLKEINEQPEAVRETVCRNASRSSLGADLGGLDLGSVDRIVIVACGTAYHAGLVGQYALEAWAGMPCEAHIASEWRYRDPRVDEGTLVLGISQSGETADTLASLRLARERGARTLGITNSPGSQVTREVDAVLHTYAGIEIGVAATKTFTSQVALMHLLALRLAELRGTLPRSEGRELVAELRALPHALERCLEQQDGIAELAERHAEKPFFLYLGRHVGLPTCLEGALKLKEISYIPTEAYAAGEMKHGPIALLDEHTPVVCVATDSHVSDKLLSNLEEVRARGAQLIAVATEGNEDVARVADSVLYVPPTHPLLQPALAVVPLQLLAYRIALLRGLDVDQPRNLAKTVTVE